MNKLIEVNRDAWAHGQITSKLWLCRKLERQYFGHNPVLWVLGGWYGLLPFLLLTREQMPIEHIRSFDIDKKATINANIVSNNYEIDSWKFRAYTQDVNTLDYSGEQYSSRMPDVVINTSCEHMTSNDWWNLIPDNTFVALQSNNLDHDDAILVHSLEEMKEKYPLTKIVFEGEIDFDYPDKSFTRYMIIGIK